MPHLLGLILGTAMLIAGGEILTRGLAARTGNWRGRIRILGTTLVALSQITPELALGVEASLTGQAQIALGALMGSCMVNLLLTPGLLLLLVGPVQIGPHHPERFVMGGVIALAIFDAVLRPTHLLLFWPVGLIYGAALVGMSFLGWQSMHPKKSHKHAAMPPDSAHYPLGLDIVLILLGVAVTAWGADGVMRHAGALGQGWGLSPTITGVVLVGLAIALPETIAALMAARHRSVDEIIRDLGISSSISVLGVAGLIGIMGEVLVPGRLLTLNFLVITASLILILPLALKRRLTRGHGIALLATCAGYIAFALK